MANLAQLAERGLAIRQAIIAAELPADLQQAIAAAYEQLGEGQPIDVAVRSSATAEDLPDASFAGQQETYLNVRGRTALLEACRRAFASLFTDRAISYRAPSTRASGASTWSASIWRASPVRRRAS